MAVAFSDLHTEAGLKALESFLAGKSYISGNKLTKDDVKVYAALLKEPSADLYPNASKWYGAISAKLAASFPGTAVGVSIGGQAAVAPAKETKESAADDDDDDLDLFGDETEEEKKAAEAREAAAKASAKKKESGKSSVLMDIKPWDDETDMKKLEEAVRSVEMPGLFWGASGAAGRSFTARGLHERNMHTGLTAPRRGAVPPRREVSCSGVGLHLGAAWGSVAARGGRVPRRAALPRRGRLINKVGLGVFKWEED
ncbi:Elongation factor 1-beta 1 [Striga hermonthica]|uniref:Elongation factor 1-beta 1 n=1 Tax=Striga hermonthica TaxID=68872 RepID=A0A9N7ML43_STRHE|nr:Elongation factor 1-beta 1 [Striga hermonthica]